MNHWSRTDEVECNLFLDRTHFISERVELSSQLLRVFLLVEPLHPAASLDKSSAGSDQTIREAIASCSLVALLASLDDNAPLRQGKPCGRQGTTGGGVLQ